MYCVSCRTLSFSQFQPYVSANEQLYLLMFLSKTACHIGNEGGGGKCILPPCCRVVQLTGFSDPVYAEATVLVNQFDISVDVLVVNQTADVMQNLSVELATVGDLKLCERPQAYTMAPKEQINMKVSIKVSSTETGAHLAHQHL